MMAERIIKRRKRSSTLRSGALPGREMLVVGVEVIMRDEKRAGRARGARARAPAGGLAVNACRLQVEPD